MRELEMLEVKARSEWPPDVPALDTTDTDSFSETMRANPAAIAKWFESNAMNCDLHVEGQCRLLEQKLEHIATSLSIGYGIPASYDAKVSYWIGSPYEFEWTVRYRTQYFGEGEWSSKKRRTMDECMAQIDLAKERVSAYIRYKYHG
jgi:hypothetical protein